MPLDFLKIRTKVLASAHNIYSFVEGAAGGWVVDDAGGACVLDLDLSLLAELWAFGIGDARSKCHYKG